eukprot:GAHX01000488.1.p1 GENE.GAHX01000488.1~~GAHX01000488.1.p1  ORF type:complete len:602 (-),score=112.89 GAHX01000488.1:1010-2815(-)
MDNNLEVRLLLKYLKENKLTDSFNALSKEAKTTVYTPIIRQNIGEVENFNFMELRRITSSSQLNKKNKGNVMGWIDLFELVCLFLNYNPSSDSVSFRSSLRRLQKAIKNTSLLNQSHKLEFRLLSLYIQSDRIKIILKGLGIDYDSNDPNHTKNIINAFFKDKILRHYKEYSDLKRINFKEIDTYDKITSSFRNVFPGFKLDSQMILNSGLQLKLVETFDNFLDDIDFITISMASNELFIVSKRQGLQRLNIQSIAKGNRPELETIVSEMYSSKLELNIAGDVIIDVENDINKSSKQQSPYSSRYSFSNFDTYKRIIGRAEVSNNGKYLAVDTSDKRVVLLSRNSENNFDILFEISDVLSYCFMEDIFICCNYTGKFGAFDLNANDKRDGKLNIEGLSIGTGDRIPVDMTYFKQNTTLYMLKINGVIDSWNLKREGSTIQVVAKPTINTNIPSSMMGKFLIVNNKVVLFMRNNTGDSDKIGDKTTHLTLYDVDNGSIIIEYEGNQKAIKYFLYPSIDAINFRYVVSGDVYGNLILWNAKTGKLIGTIKAHSCISNSTAMLMMDEKYYVFSASDDRTLKVWQLIEDEFNDMPLMASENSDGE